MALREGGLEVEVEVCAESAESVCEVGAADERADWAAWEAADEEAGVVEDGEVEAVEEEEEDDDATAGENVTAEGNGSALEGSACAVLLAESEGAV